MAAILALIFLVLLPHCRGFLPPAPSGGLGGGVRAGTMGAGDELRKVTLEDTSSRGGRVLETARGEDILRSALGSGPGSLGSLVALAPSAFLNLAPLYLPDPAKVNPDCRRDLLALYTAFDKLNYLLKAGTLWPLKLVDSWGKFADGIMLGNLKLVGFFSECVNLRVRPQTLNTSQIPELQDYRPGLDDNTFDLEGIFLGLKDNLRKIHRTTNSRSNLHSPQNLKQRVPDLHPGLRGFQSDSPLVLNASFQGQYCLLNYGPSGNTSGSGPAARTPLVSANLPLYASLLYYATCIPSTCTPTELKASVDDVLAHTGQHVRSIQCQVDRHHTLDSSQLTGIVLLSIVGAVLAAATVLDLWTRSLASTTHLRQGRLRYLLVFSVSENLQKLFQVTVTRSPGVISCLHGIRFLSITWVVLGHQYAYSTSVAQNELALVKMSKPVAFQVIANADVSVDTFFLMSGLLVSTGLLRLVATSGTFNAPYYYIHRIVRLLPPIALTVLVVATVSGLFVEGPASQGYTTYYLKGCRHSWWMDLTFTSNLFFPYLVKMGKTDEGSTCLPHCWYTGVDMQLYLVTPLVLLPLCFWPKSGGAWAWVWAWTAASVVVPAVVVGAYHTWPASLLLQNDTEAMLEYNHKVYLMPWCRAGPYMVGVWAGYTLHRATDAPALARLNKWQVVVGWVSAVVVALAVLLGIARYNYVGTPSTVPQMSLLEAVFYGGVHRTAWAAAVAWVILACHWGYGGPVNWVLSHPCWQPLSRLTYCVYLTSLPLQFMLLYSTQRPTYYTHITKVQEACGTLLLALAAAVFVTLVAESPILRLEKLLLHSSGARKEPEEAVADREVMEEARESQLDLRDVKVDLHDDLRN
nr:nose resistant to fluoxetine protein 6-like [Procambarus clarkii]